MHYKACAEPLTVRSPKHSRLENSVHRIRQFRIRLSLLARERCGNLERQFFERDNVRRLGLAAVVDSENKPLVARNLRHGRTARRFAHNLEPVCAVRSYRRIRHRQGLKVRQVYAQKIQNFRSKTASVKRGARCHTRTLPATEAAAAAPAGLFCHGAI